MKNQIDKLVKNDHNYIRKYRDMILESLFNFSNKNANINRDIYSSYFYDNVDQLINKHLIEKHADLIKTIDESVMVFTSKKKL